MYTSFFGLNEKPFSITPDPRYLFMSERHGEALAHLVYGVTESGGFMQLTGEVGTGKTTLVRTLLQNRMPNNADVAVVLNPQLSALEFLQTIGEELGIPQPEEKGSIKALIDTLNRHLLDAHAKGRRTILVVDEAQNLARDVLEQVRLLTNLETSKQKLLQIILIGQPELRELLARNDLRQLAQRITGRYHLEPLTRDETAQYIDHRTRVAGAANDLFDAGAKKEVFRLSQGVPRLINVICDRALLGAYGRESRRVTRRMVQRAEAEISGKTYTAPWLRLLAPVLALTAIAVVAIGAWALLSGQHFSDNGTGTASAPSEPAETATQAVESRDNMAISAAVADPITRIAETADTAPAPADPIPTLDEALLLASDLTGRNTALAGLFQLWGLGSPGSPNTCADALEFGLECLEQRGSWTSLRQFDRPAVLTLTDSRGDSHAVVLTAIDDQQAHISIGGVDVSHSIDEVSAAWFGEFLLLWRPANGESLALGPGSENSNVVWLREHLADIDARYRAEPLNSTYYDNNLQARVREFQRDNRLAVDGVAGSHTQIVINSLTAGNDVPRLSATSPERN